MKIGTQMSTLFCSLKNREAILYVHIILICVCTIFYLYLFLNDIFYQKIAEFLVLFSFGWVYFSSGLLKIPFFHPYRMFLLTLFLYNISGIGLSFLNILDLFKDLILGGVSNSFYTHSIIIEVFACITTFVLFIHLAVILYSYRKVSISTNTEWRYNRVMEKTGIYVFYIFLVPSLYYYYLLIAQYIAAGGYLYQSQVEGTVNTNILIRISDDFWFLGLILILASKAEIKKILFPVILYVLVFLLLSFVSGSRVYFVSLSLAIASYFCFRNLFSPKILIIILAIFVSISMIIGVVRGASDYEQAFLKMRGEKKSENALIEFISQQASTMHIIGLTAFYVENKKIDFSCRYLYDMLILPTGYIKGKPVGDYYLLSDRLALLTLKSDFSMGAGLGTSIIAEFYICGGICAVMLLSFIWGLFLMHIYSIAMRSNFYFLCFLLMLPGIYYTPRAHPLYPILSLMQPLILYGLIICFRKLAKSN